MSGEMTGTWNAKEMIAGHVTWKRAPQHCRRPCCHHPSCVRWWQCWLEKKYLLQAVPVFLSMPHMQTHVHAHMLQVRLCYQQIPGQHNYQWMKQILQCTLKKGSIRSYWNHCWWISPPIRKNTRCYYFHQYKQQKTVFVFLHKIVQN